MFSIPKETRVLSSVIFLSRVLVLVSPRVVVRLLLQGVKADIGQETNSETLSLNPPLTPLFQASAFNSNYSYNTFLSTNIAQL